MTGASRHPAEAHNGLFFSPCYKYHLHSCVGGLLLIPIAEKHLRECQEEQGPSEVIEIWKFQREPSLVRSRVAKCASTLLIRLVVVKWEFVLVTLCDCHHLDGLVVIGSLVIIQRACGWPNSSCERLWVIHHDGVSKNQPVESTWSLCGSRGCYTLVPVLQWGLVGSGDSPIPWQNIAVFPLLSLLWAFTLCNSILVIYIHRIAMLELD
jgi:hypothetical protein